MDDFEQYNNKILTSLSYFLNTNPCSITTNQVRKVTACGVDTLFAYRLLLIQHLEITDNFLITEYINNMLFLESVKDYDSNPYLKNIHFTNIKKGKWALKNSSYKPFELFVHNDFIYKGGKVIPQLGFFERPFSFPAIYQNNVLWMSITPNEINTMKDPINQAFGKVLTFGLGLGYYAYMTSIKENVESVTIVEYDRNAIFLFENYILPQFSNSKKIKIIECDAYEFYKKMIDGEYDFVFVDIYHDASDGLEVLNKFKETEDRFKKTIFSYWIEKTINYYR